ncbi:MAG: LptF/LptG family permease [Nitrospinae bacterium]|nr:LptF/LptG family permease [Nitrospinota bacterium]
MNTLDRYILSEQAKVFLISVFILLSVLLLEKVNFLSGLLLTKGASFKSIGELLLYLSPSFFTLAAPLAMLMSSLLIFSRFAGDNEITAMKSAGISPWRILRAPLILSGGVFLATLYLSVFVAHKGNLHFRDVVVDIIRSNISMNIKERRFNENFGKLLVHVNENDNGQLSGVFISDGRNPAKPRIIEAKRGHIHSGEAGDSVVMDLYTGVIHSLGADGMYQTIGYDNYTLKVELEGEFSKPAEKEIPHLSLPELSERITQSEQQGLKASAEKVAYHKAFSAPVGCLVLGLLGAPLGILTHRRGSAGGFGVGVLMIVINYLLWMIGQGLGSEGKLPPVLAIWAPDIIMGAAALYFVYHVSRDSAPVWIEKTGWVFSRLWKK